MTLPESEWLTWFVTRVDANLLGPTSLRDNTKILLFVSIGFLLEVAAKKNWRLRYGSRNFRIDVLYYIFYYTGIYQILIYTWIYRSLTHLVTAYAPWMKMELFSGMSPGMQIVVLILAADFFGYWSHRLRHAYRFLWVFHSIHHSQTILTPVANFRFHFVDETVLRLCLFIPFTMLGIPVMIWLWVDLFMAWVLLLQHSEWSWTYGPFGRIFVSPAFHRIHHAKDERLHNSNYAMLFSFWDDLFGTAERKAPVPAEHGLPGDPVPETVMGQILYPFREIARDFRRPSQDAVPAAPRIRGVPE
jgi:sterol desaturase/sphingolipid hydroxylase (fatty acid hydroxylase superfamily)